MPVFLLVNSFYIKDYIITRRKRYVSPEELYNPLPWPYNWCISDTPSFLYLIVENSTIIYNIPYVEIQFIRRNL